MVFVVFLIYYFLNDLLSAVHLCVQSSFPAPVSPMKQAGFSVPFSSCKVGVASVLVCSRKRNVASRCGSSNTWFLASPKNKKKVYPLLLSVLVKALCLLKWWDRDDFCSCQDQEINLPVTHIDGMGFVPISALKVLPLIMSAPINALTRSVTRMDGFLDKRNKQGMTLMSVNQS